MKTLETEGATKLTGKEPDSMESNAISRQTQGGRTANTKFDFGKKVHSEFEWPDTYAPQNLEDLKRFYDRYLRGIRNGWEITPRIRMEVMDAYNYSYQVGRPEQKFSLARTQYSKLYLDAATGAMAKTPYSNESSVSYDSKTGETNFIYTFPEETELTGYMKLRLYVEAKSNDDMDLFINVKKDSTTGEELPVRLFGTENHPGAWGKLRVSLRHTDEAKSKEYQPYYTYDREEKRKRQIKKRIERIFPPC